MCDKKLSFVVPVYNVESYLRECVDSILRQANDLCEIILVDDGSTDSSGEICDEYLKISDLVCVVHKENAGLASARNVGIEKSCGEYVGFIDSDDRIADGCIEKILQATKSKADLFFMQGIKFFADGKTQDMGDEITSHLIEGKTPEELLDFIATRPKYPGSSCTKIYKRKFLVENEIYFPKTKRLSEDLGFVLDCLLKVKTFIALDCPYYEYRQNRKDSITNTFNIQNFCDKFLFIEESVEKAKLYNLTESNKRSVFSIAAYEYAILLWQYSFIEKKHKKKAKQKLKEYKWILKYGQTVKQKITSKMVMFLGLTFTSKLLNLYKKHN